MCDFDVDFFSITSIRQHHAAIDSVCRIKWFYSHSYSTSKSVANEFPSLILRADPEGLRMRHAMRPPPIRDLEIGANNAGSPCQAQPSQFSPQPRINHWLWHHMMVVEITSTIYVASYDVIG